MKQTKRIKYSIGRKVAIGGGEEDFDLETGTFTGLGVLGEPPVELAPSPFLQARELQHRMFKKIFPFLRVLPIQPIFLLQVQLLWQHQLPVVPRKGTLQLALVVVRKVESLRS